MIGYIAGDPYELVSPEANDRMEGEEHDRDRLAERLGPMCDLLDDDEVGRWLALGHRCGRLYREQVEVLRKRHPQGDDGEGLVSPPCARRHLEIDAPPGPLSGGDR